MGKKTGLDAFSPNIRPCGPLPLTLAPLLPPPNQVSITSLEVYHAVMGCRRDAKDAEKGPHAFFFMRDPAFKAKIDKGMQWIFDFEHLEEDAKVEAGGWPGRVVSSVSFLTRSFSLFACPPSFPLPLLNPRSMTQSSTSTTARLPRLVCLSPTPA